MPSTGLQESSLTTREVSRLQWPGFLADGNHSRAPGGNTFLGTTRLSETGKQAALATMTWSSGNEPPTAHASPRVGDDRRWRISEGVRRPSCSESGALRARGVQAAVNTGMDPPGPSYLDHSWTHSSDFPQK